MISAAPATVCNPNIQYTLCAAPQITTYKCSANEAKRGLLVPLNVIMNLEREKRKEKEKAVIMPTENKKP